MRFSSTSRKRKHEKPPDEDFILAKRHKKDQENTNNPQFNTNTIWESLPNQSSNLPNLEPDSNTTNEIQSTSNIIENKADIEVEEDIDLLLYQLANLDVDNDQNSTQRCPICTVKIADHLFAKHVYDCLDNMDVNDRSNLKFQIDHDKRYAEKLSMREGYAENFIQRCPICNKTLELGSGINVHINYCLDQQSNNNNGDIIQEEEKNDMKVNSNVESGNSSQHRAKGLDARQMISCASALMKEQKGSDSYSQMLDMFNHLGFNAKNIKSVLRQSTNVSSNSNMNENSMHSLVDKNLEVNEMHGGSEKRNVEQRMVENGSRDVYQFQFHPKIVSTNPNLLSTSVNDNSFRPSPLVLPTSVSVSASAAVSMNLNVNVNEKNENVGKIGLRAYSDGEDDDLGQIIIDSAHVRLPNDDEI